MRSRVMSQVVLPLSGVLLAVGSGVAWHRSSVRARALELEVSDLQSRLGQLESERDSDARGRGKLLAELGKLAELGRQAELGGQAVVTTETPVLGAGEGDDDRPPGDLASPSGCSAPPERDPARGGTFLASLEEAVEKGPAEERWSQPLLHEAEAAVSRALRGARIVERRCGPAMCRIVVQHDSSGDDDSSAEGELMRVSPFNTGATILHVPGNEREPARSRIYLPR